VCVAAVILTLLAVIAPAHAAIAGDNDTVSAGASDGGASHDPIASAPKKSRVIFEAPVNVEALSVTFDGASVPVASMTTRAFTIEPGDHVVVARGMRDGKEVAYEARFHFEPGDFFTVQLPMAEVPAPAPQESGCLVPSHTEEELRACVAVRNAPQQGCGACVIAHTSPSLPPALLVVLPIVAIARRLSRRSRQTT
jgi:hypothetical protein